MKIYLNKKRLKTHLFIGALWMILGLSYFIFGETMFWLDYAYVSVGAFDLFQYFYSLKHHYLIIENGTITKNVLYGFQNKIELNEIKEIKKIGGDYILKSQMRNLKINPDLIQKESLEKLNTFLKKLNLPSEKNFLTR